MKFYTTHNAWVARFVRLLAWLGVDYMRRAYFWERVIYSCANACARLTGELIVTRHGRKAA